MDISGLSMADAIAIHIPLPADENPLGILYNESLHNSSATSLNTSTCIAPGPVELNCSSTMGYR